jgi:hypothetical protein
MNVRHVFSRPREHHLTTQRSGQGDFRSLGDVTPKRGPDAYAKVPGAPDAEPIDTSAPIGMRGVERARGNSRRGLRVERACGRERDSARKCHFGAQTPRDTPACRMSCKTGAARSRSCASLGGDSLTPTAIDFPSLMRWLLVRRRRYLQHQGRIAIENVIGPIRGAGFAHLGPTTRSAPPSGLPARSSG